MFGLRIVAMVLSLLMVALMVSFIVIEKKSGISVNKKQKYIKLIIISSVIVSVLIILVNIFNFVFK